MQVEMYACRFTFLSIRMCVYVCVNRADVTGTDIVDIVSIFKRDI